MLNTLAELQPWADPNTIAFQRLAMRVPSTGYATVTAARTNDRGASPWWQSLNGTWRLALYPSPQDVPPETTSAAADTSLWAKVAVPGNWTMQDTGDLPHYTNVQMPFPGPPPSVPLLNTTGVYRRTVRISKQWLKARRVVLHIGGAESVHAVYVNGAFVGYGTDSRLASEYDITNAIEGRNERDRHRGDAL